MNCSKTRLRNLASFAILTLVAASAAKADLLAHYVDGSANTPAALLNLTTPSGYTASGLSCVGISATATTNYYTVGNTEWWMFATSSAVAAINPPVSTDDYYQFSVTAIGENMIDPTSLTFDWVVTKWGDSGGITGYYQVFVSTDGSTFSSVGSGGSLEKDGTNGFIGPEANTIDLTSLSPASSYTFRIALSDNSGNTKNGILLQNFKLNGAVLEPTSKGTLIFLM